MLAMESVSAQRSLEIAVVLALGLPCGDLNHEIRKEPRLCKRILHCLIHRTRASGLKEWRVMIYRICDLKCTMLLYRLGLMMMVMVDNLRR